MKGKINMWTNKKELIDLADDYLKLKKENEELNHIKNLINYVKVHGVSDTYYVDNSFLLISNRHYSNLIQQINLFKKENKDLKKQLEMYKEQYVNELQKRLELAEMVKKMDGD